MVIECVWCGSRIDIGGSAGWPYVRTRAVIHLRRCEKRPAEASDKEIDRLGDQIADRTKHR